uniref:Uncharacterized protein n=1 Tax=Candidatus Kentrum sp. FW TaxID=2126338 RepID=A0A450TIA1_9GAMM|nr:MAG: hypothetical protein BECKFW1821B_GA0114236_11237 [Candidatus Kentron sp. FW]
MKRSNFLIVLSRIFRESRLFRQTHPTHSSGVTRDYCHSSPGEWSEYRPMGFRGVEPGFPHLLRPRKVKQNIPLMLQSDMTLKFCFTFCVFNKNNAHNQSLQRTANPLPLPEPQNLRSRHAPFPSCRMIRPKAGETQRNGDLQNINEGIQRLNGGTRNINDGSLTDIRHHLYLPAKPGSRSHH